MVNKIKNKCLRICFLTLFSALIWMITRSSEEASIQSTSLYHLVTIFYVDFVIKKSNLLLEIKWQKLEYWFENRGLFHQHFMLCISRFKLLLALGRVHRVKFGQYSLLVKLTGIFCTSTFTLCTKNVGEWNWP